MSQTLIYAHRGANREAAENTRSAFDRALHYPVDGMETDVQLSRDGVPVLWHDRLLGKLGMASKHIDDFDYAQLREMDFAAHFAGSTHPEGIMSLREFVEAYRSRCGLLLEIKNRDWEKADRHASKVRQTLDMLGEVDSARIQVSSFNLSSLVYAHEYRPGFPLVYNFEDDQTLADAQRVLAEHPFLYGLCLPIATLDAAIVKLLRAQDKRIAVYTCNSDEEISKALQLGVDILISDVPQKALQMRVIFD
ncbi:MAG TPA: glycerophosphodiester phosphodiesterase [Gallionellaceae bacterium]|nr:glycerophosphodiester phosphodiesterase [Gallionellaceae bacterium]